MDRQPQEGKFKMRPATTLFLFLLPLLLVSCATTRQTLGRLVGMTPAWYESYGFDSREKMISIASVPVLIDALGDPDSRVRAEVARALAEIGPDAKDAVPPLIEVLKDEDYTVRQTAADALEAISLDDMVVKTNGEEADKINILVQTTRLDSQDWMVQRAAVNRLIEVGRDAVDAMPALVGILEGRSNDHPLYSEVIRGAVTVLGNIGTEAQAANPALINLMDHKDYQVRLEVVKALGKIGPQTDTAVIETLIRALHGNPELMAVRDVFADALPSSMEDLAYKGIIYGDADGDVRREAAASLGNFGTHAAIAVPVMLDAALTDIDYGVRRQAAVSLTRIEPGGEAAMKALDKALADFKEPLTREFAVMELRNAPQDVREKWLPKIIICLDDIEEGVRLNAVKTLGAYKISNDMVRKALNRVALEDKSLTVKKAALETLQYLNHK